MAKKEDTRFGRSKMTVMLFQLDGNDQTLQEGIRTISGAIHGMMKPSRALPLNTAAPISDGDGSETAAGETVDLAPDNTDAMMSVEGESRRATPPRPPEVLHDLKVPVEELRKYCESKAVGTIDTKRYLAITGFLKEHMNISSVTMDHIYTCYRLLSWNTPKDAGSPLRSLKRKGLFQKGDESGAYILNHVGENAVRDLGNDAP